MKAVGKEILFLYPLGYIHGDMQIKLTKDRLTGEKAYNFTNFMCMRVHRKQVKFKDVVRLKGLLTIFQKGKGVWISIDDKL